MASALQLESESAPESAWFFTWVKSAMLYLAVVTGYLGAVLGLVAAWKKFVAEAGDKANLTTYALAGVLALPLLFALLFNLLPALRRRRERSLRPAFDPDRPVDPTYFQTGPRMDDPHGFFARGYEPFLRWARQPPASLLRLTGLSGSGKSSLLSAYLKPQLERPTDENRTTVVILRSYRDPLESLKSALSTLWRRQPPDFDQITPLDALHRADRLLGRADRLLIAFDQFDEFFLLRVNVAAGTSGSAGTDAGKLGASTEIVRLRNFFHDFLARPTECIALLLSYREDQHGLLAALDLPHREEGRNWMKVEPWDFSAATNFLRSCPGLVIPEARMDRVLVEAARQEGGRTFMRPIVANLLGVVLRRMAGHPTLWKEKGDLLRGYVRDCLGSELRDERVRLLRVLVTGSHTAQPLALEEMTRETGLEATELEGQLEHFAHAGLVRCVNGNETMRDRRVWQIAHDFLATLIERVLDATQRTPWRRLRPWLAPLAAMLSALLFLILPWVQQSRDIAALANAGFTWNAATSTVEAGTEEGRHISSLVEISGILRRLQPCDLRLKGCVSLRNLEGLGGLTSLRRLDLGGCIALQNIEELKELGSLQSLDLDSCGTLKDMDVLGVLKSLQSLNLSNCEALRNADVLKGLTSLISLNLGFCHGLQNVNGLEDLHALQSLDLTFCDELQNVSAVENLTSLQSLDLSSCPVLRSVDSLGRLISLQRLNLSYCRALQNIDGLRGLRALRYLNLGNCGEVQNVEIINGLTLLQSLDLSSCRALLNGDEVGRLASLQSLNLSSCPGLQNVSGLGRLNSLRNLNLSNCSALRNVDGLKGLPLLQSVNLSFCAALRDVDGLAGLVSLQSLDLGFCATLRNVDGLRGLASLQNLDVSYCLALRNVDGLRGLSALQTLDLSGCNAIPRPSWSALILALPNTSIILPDRSPAGTGPQSLSR